MPFISKDWRSPGDYWVKNGSGWERFKVLQYVGGSQESGPGQEAEQQQQQPHCRINLRQTREISGFNTLSEALQQLDFQNALRDQRKFQYICVIIRLLISNPYLSGNSQRILVKLLFQICDQVRIGWRYDLLHAIITEMRKSLDNCWGGNLGCKQLWDENKLQIDRLEELLAANREEAPRIPLQEFPEDIIRLIVLKLNSDKDLKNLAEADDTMKALVGENRIWRQLCIYHFSRENIISTTIKLKEQQEEEKSQSKGQRQSNPFLRRQESSSASAKNTKTTTSSDEDKENDDGVSSNNNNNNNNNNEETSSAEINNNDNNDAAAEKGLDWETIYKYLKRNFSLKEEYAETLNYCKPCNVLFWPSFGHPCIVGTSVFLDKDIETKDLLVDVKPGDFVSFFST